MATFDSCCGGLVTPWTPTQVFVTKKGVETIATVVKIHRDDPEELYVTVRDAGGQERQTLCGNQISSARHHRRDVVAVTASA